MKVSSLAGVIATKGHATSSAITEPVTKTKVPRKNYAKSLTVKLDRERYNRLKLESVRRETSNQAILVEALDKYWSQS